MAKHFPKIGAHVSIAGGIAHAPTRAQREGCDTFQCFTRSPQGGPAPELTEDVVAAFREAMATADMGRFVIHAPYYINLASTEARIRHASRRVIREELERGSVLGATYVMFHPGSHRGRTAAEGIVAVRKGLLEILHGYQGSCQLLLEVSAGAGDVLGDTFQENATMMEPVRSAHGFGGICFDTCHAFASGYDFRTPEALAQTLATFDECIGLEYLKLTHVNDSAAPLGEHRDRHEHIGEGHIGKEGMALILSSEPFRRIDWILETRDEGRERDVAFLAKLRQKVA